MSLSTKQYQTDERCDCEGLWQTLLISLDTAQSKLQPHSILREQRSCFLITEMTAVVVLDTYKMYIKASQPWTRLSCVLFIICFKLKLSCLFLIQNEILVHLVWSTDYFKSDARESQRWTLYCASHYNSFDFNFCWFQNLKNPSKKHSLFLYDISILMKYCFDEHHSSMLKNYLAYLNGPFRHLPKGAFRHTK